MGEDVRERHSGHVDPQEERGDKEHKGVRESIGEEGGRDGVVQESSPKVRDENAGDPGDRRADAHGTCAELRRENLRSVSLRTMSGKEEERACRSRRSQPRVQQC